MNAVPSLEWNRIELARCLDEAAELPGVDASACAWLHEKLSEEVFNLVVAGQFKRGKSSIINALLGEALLPTGVVPLTSVVTVILAGPAPRVRVQFRDGRSKEVDPGKLAAHVTVPGNPGNAKGVRQVLIEHPAAGLASGVRLIDTPGIGSLYAHNTDVAREFLPQADAVLFVASVDQPLSREELDFLDSIRQQAEKVFCLLNKTDYLRPDELRESLGFVTQAIHTALGVVVPVYPVSARLALEARLTREEDMLARSGFKEFEQALRRFMAEEKTDAWLRSVARSLVRILAQARFALELEAQALRSPLERLEENLRAFATRKQDVQGAAADHQVLLEANARALLQTEVEAPLDEFKRALQERLGASVDQWYRDLSALPSRKLKAQLESRIIEEIRTSYDGWLARTDRTLSRGFDALCARFWHSIQETVDDLVRYSGELFGLGFVDMGMEARWTTESGFYYRFWYEPTSLRILSTSAVLALPKRFATKLIVRRMKGFAHELAEMQAGRIRYDLDERLKIKCAGRAARIDGPGRGHSRAHRGRHRRRDRHARPKHGACRGAQCRARPRHRKIAALETRVKENTPVMPQRQT